MSKDTKILFPTEFGPLGAKAEANAVNLARLYDAELVLLHAIHLPSGVTRFFSNVSEDELRKKAMAELEGYKKTLDPNGEMTISTMVAIGEPEESIVQVAKDIAASLVIFGTKGGSGLRDTLLGSAVNHVIRHAPCPVITIRNTPDYTGFKNILVPVDLSQEAGEKVRWGVELAEKYGSKLTFYSVLSGSPEEVKKLEGRLQKSVDLAVAKGVKNVEAHEQITDKSVADAILDYADNCDADLICIMTQTESEAGLKTSLLGTVADRLVNISQRPVISIRPERHYRSSSFQSAHFT
jgi:nucleotide-binding universal stress UspA family protein